MALELGRNRVRERAHSLHTGVVVLEHGEVSIEEVVGLADWNLEREPVARRGDSLGRDPVLLQPCIDSVNARLCGSDELLYLWTRQKS